MNTEAVYELFLSVLQVHGYAAVPAGDVIMVVQQNSVKQQGRDLEDKYKKQSQEMVTKVITIKNTPALDLVPIYAHWLLNMDIWLGLSLLTL